MHVHNLLKNVNHLGHLGKDQHFLSPLFDVLQQPNQLHQLPTVVKQYILLWEIHLETRLDSMEWVQ